jgi:hypothetical protein
MRRPTSCLIRLCCILIVICLCIGTSAAATGIITLSNPQTPLGQRTVVLNGTVYLSKATLQQRFQESIDKELPTLKGGAIQNIIGGLPSWAGQFADSLLQPSVKLVTLTPQSEGLRADLLLSLYPGDPNPTTIGVLVTFKRLNSNTVQVSGQALNDQPVLLSGPLTTITLPIGQITSIKPTPSCGSAGLQIGLQLPIHLAPQRTQTPAGQPSAIATGNATASALLQASDTMASPVRFSQNDKQREQDSDQMQKESLAAKNTLAASVELPASALTKLTSGLGTITINGNLQAQNLQIHEESGTYRASADIIDHLLGNLTLNPGTVTTTITPQASNGQLKLTATNTTIHTGFLTLPLDTYNQQITQALNTTINKALQNKVTIDTAGIGPTSQIPCAAANSLLLSGTVALP